MQKGQSMVHVCHPTKKCPHPSCIRLKSKPQQEEESRSELNRYYFWQAHGRDAAHDAELLDYYIAQGADKTTA